MFFGRIHDQTLLLKSGVSRLISVRLKDAKKLGTLKGSLNTYGIKELLKNIEKYFHENPNLSVELLCFVKEYITANPTFLNGFAKKSILLTEKNTFALISHSYVIEDTGTRHSFVAQLNLNVISPSIAAVRELRSWLQQEGLGLRSMTSLNVIRGHVFDLIKNDQVTPNNSVDIFSFVFDTYLQMRNEFNSDDFEILSKLKVHRADSSFLPTNECYLLSRESELCEKLSISCRYTQHIKDNVSWNEFLLKMGVKTEIRLDVYNVPSTELVNLSQDQSGKVALQKYYEHFWEANLVNLSVQQKAPHANTRFINLIYFKFIHLLHEESYAQLFWAAIAKGAWALGLRCDFVRPKKKDIEGVTQYLKFDLKTFPRLKAVGTHGFYRSVDLYSPNLQEAFSDLPLLFANVPIPLTPAQIDFFGFKKTINLTACLQLLDNPICNQSPLKLNKIYSILISLHDINQTELQTWKVTGRLLAADNKPYPLDSLIVNDGHGATPFDPRWLHSCDLSSQQLLKLAKFFGLNRLSSRQDEFIYKDASPELTNENVAKLTSRLKMFLPALAYRQSISIPGKSASIILKELIEKLQATRIIYHEKISLVSLNKTSVATYSVTPQPAVFRFSGRWQEKTYRLDVVVAVLSNQIFGFSGQTSVDLKYYLSLGVATTREIAYKWLKKDYGDESRAALNDLYALAETFEEPVPNSPGRSPGTPVTAPTNQKKTLSPPVSPRGANVPTNPGSPSAPNTPPKNIIIKEAKLTPKKSPGTPPKTSPFNTANKKNNRPKTDNAENTHTGRKGEQYVYAALLTKYGNKYSYENLREEQKGFQVITPKRQLDITWYNKGLPDDEDMGEDHDIKINKKEPHDLIILQPDIPILVEKLVRKKFYIQPNKNTFDVYWMQHARRRFKQLSPDIDRDLIQQLMILSAQTSKEFSYETIAKVVDALVLACDRNTRYIEVKSTKGHSKLCYISKAEWQKMNNARFRYQLFRVYEVNDATVPNEISFVRDPAEALEEGKLSVQSIELSL